MSDLSGRELDMAIAEALGWELGLVGRARKPGGRMTYMPKFHASLDAIKAVEPEGKDISLSLTHDEDRKFWVCTMWDTIKDEDGFNDYDIAAESEGSTEPEARARALLAWLTRENKA